MNENLPVVDVAKIRMAINAEVPLTITTYTLPHRMELYMNAVLTTFFKELRIRLKAEKELRHKYRQG